MSLIKLNQHKMLIVAAVVAVAGIGAALHSIRKAASSQQQYTLPKVESAPAVRRSASELALQPEEIAASVLAGAIESGLSPGHEAKLLARAVRSTVEMYLAGSIEGYETWLQSEGLEPPAAWAEISDQNRDSIEMGFATLRAAPMDAEGVIVRPFPLPWEQDDDKDRASSMSVSAHRWDRSQTDENGRRAMEIVIPAQINALTAVTLNDPSRIGPAVRVDARIGLVYHWSPTKEKWIIVEFRVYDIPQGAFAVLPSL